MKKVVVLAVLAGALAAPGVASAKGFRGVVVARQGATALVAEAHGTVHAVRARTAVGARVSVTNGQVRVVGHARHATVRGVVVKRSGPHVFLAAAHHLLAVQAPAAAKPAQPGAVESVDVQIGQAGELDEENEDAVGQQSTVQIQAPVLAVAAGSITLSVNGQPLVLALPAGLTLPATLVGQVVTVTVSLANGQPTVRAEDDGNDDNSGDGGDGGRSGGGGDGGGDD